MVQSETAAAATEDWPSIPRAQLHSLPPGGQAGYGDILGSLDMYTLASQTQDFIGGLLGKMVSRVDYLFPISTLHSLAITLARYLVIFS